MCARAFRCCVLLFFAVSLLHADDLSSDRDLFKNILNAVASDVQKNYYDPNMKGLDVKALQEQAKQRIENAKSTGEMMRAVFIFTEKFQDSHTKFLPPDRNVKYKFGFDAKPFGDEVRVYKVKEKGAADRADLKPGDVILKLNGYKVERKTYDLMMWDFRVMRNLGALDMVVQSPDGQPRNVRLEGERKVQAKVLDFAHDVSDIYDLIRDSEEPTWHYKAFSEGVGYAQMRSFPFEGEDFMNGIIEKSNSSRALILDFRSNGGGSEDTLRNFAGNFGRDQVVLAEVRGRKKTEQILVKPRRLQYTVPLFILIDSETGSAAEMFARHMQLHKQATVIGDQSSGRVTRSRYFMGEIGTDRVVPFGTQIDVGKVVFSDGHDLEQNGVFPDEKCIPSALDMRNHKDTCLAKAVSMARKAANLSEGKLEVNDFANED